MIASAFQSHERDVPPDVLESTTDEQFLANFNPDLPAFGEIGHVEGSHGQALAYLMRVAREADEARQDFLGQADQNALVYWQGQVFAPAEDQIVANEIQTAVLSITNLQTVEPFAIFIRPVQTRDKAQVYWIGPPVDPNVSMLTGLPVGLGMMPVIDPMTGQPAMQAQVDPATGQPAVDPMTGQAALQPMMRPVDPDTDQLQPLDQVTAWQVKKLLATGAFPAEWLVSLDDRLTADVYQTVFDVFWQEARGDDFIRETLLATNVYGYQTGYYGWDSERKEHIVRPVSIKQAFLDPAQPTLELASYFMMDVEMDVAQAKAEYPQIASLIDEKAKIGFPSRVDSATQFGVGSDRSFNRRTVTFRIAWFRNQQVPMTPDEAVKSGKVFQDEMTGEYHLPGGNDGGNLSGGTAVQTPAIDGAGQHDDGTGLGAPELPVSGGDQGGAGENQQLARMAQDGGAPPPPPGGNDDNAQAAPASVATAPASWPLTLGIRQIATLAQTGLIVQDIRCEHWDIPALLNKSIAIPMQPFAQGIPQKLKGLQQADIRALNAMLTYVEMFANPGCALPQSVATALGETVKRAFIRPTEPLVFPDALYEKFQGKAVTWYQPPALSAAVGEALNLIQDRMQSTSGHPEVMSGKAPSPSSSGRMVEALQQGAAGQFGFQAQWTAQMVERLANLMHYTHVWRLDLDDMMQIYSRLPRQLMAMVMDRGKRGRWDIKVDTNAGAGGMTNKKIQRAMALFQAVSPKTGEPALPLRMLREAANIDDEEASLAYRDELQSSTPIVPMMPPGGGAPPGAGGPPQDPMQPPSDAMGSAQQGF